MNNARTKYMAQLIAEVFNVQEYEAAVSKYSNFSSHRKWNEDHYKIKTVSLLKSRDLFKIFLKLSQILIVFAATILRKYKQKHLRSMVQGHRPCSHLYLLLKTI